MDLLSAMFGRRHEDDGDDDKKKPSLIAEPADTVPTAINVVNMTGKPVNFCTLNDSGGLFVYYTVPATLPPPLLKMVYRSPLKHIPTDAGFPVPIMQKLFFDPYPRVIGLPPENENTIYIVARDVAATFGPERQDLYLLTPPINATEVENATPGEVYHQGIFQFDQRLHKDSL
jgi:hypothetical protein